MPLFKGSPWRNLAKAPLCKEFVAFPSMVPPRGCPCFGDTVGMVVCHSCLAQSWKHLLSSSGRSISAAKGSLGGPWSVGALGNKILAGVREIHPITRRVCRVVCVHVACVLVFTLCVWNPVVDL